jgi:hypothetical protein
MWRSWAAWWRGRRLVERWVIGLWAAALAGILVRLLLLPHGAHTLFPIYHDAGRHWVRGVDLYPEQVQGAGFALYRYSPTVAVGLTPFSPLPQKLADLLWRLLNAAALLGGALWAARAVASRALSRGQATLMLLLLFPPAVGHLSNGQCNALVIGLILCSFAASAERRWNLSAGLMAAAALFKLYPIAAGLLLAVVHPRRFGPRFLIALAVGMALPFACQSPEYVLRQFRLWIGYTLHEDRSGWGLDSANVDLQLLLRVCGLPLSLKAYRLIEALAGLGFAGLCLAARRRGVPERRRLTLALGLGCVWMTVFGPATESPTYLILAPSVALGLIAAWDEGAARSPGVRLLVRGLMLGSYVLFLSLQLTTWSGRLFYAYRVLGPQPVAGLLFLAGLLLHEWNRPADRGERTEGRAAPAVRAA